ncbi:MAG: hypothetical protein REH79_00420 [Spiroplasma sp.]|nr:hypothetical protein [Spiroplasma sp.]
MTIWELLGFGVNHERLVKYEQKAIEQQNMRIEGLVRDINYHGIDKLLKRNTYDIKDIKAVLKFFEEPPIKSTDWKTNWPEAKQWLYEQEHPEVFQLRATQKDLKEQKKKIQKLEEKITEFERNK